MNARESTTKFPLSFFLLVFVLSVPFWLIDSAVEQSLQDEIPVELPFGALQFVNTLAAALILVHKEDGSGGVRKLLKRAFDYGRIKSRTWYVPALCLWPAAMFVEYGFMRLIGAPLPDAQFPALTVPFFLVLFFVAGACEELGWQGYAFERLYGRWCALEASLILVRVLIVWLYNNTGRSVFAASLFHATSNVSQFSFPDYGTHYDPFVACVILTFAAAAVTFLFGPKTLARRRTRRQRGDDL